MKPSLGIGVGLRFYVAHALAIRAELKDYVFPDQYRLGVGTSSERTVNGLTGVLMFMAGASLYF